MTVYNTSDREGADDFWGYKIQTLLTNRHMFSYGISWENLLEEQSNFSWVISLLLHKPFLDIVRRKLMFATFGAKQSEKMSVLPRTLTYLGSKLF